MKRELYAWMSDEGFARDARYHVPLVFESYAEASALRLLPTLLGLKEGLRLIKFVEAEVLEEIGGTPN